MARKSATYKSTFTLEERIYNQLFIFGYRV